MARPGRTRAATAADPADDEDLAGVGFEPEPEPAPAIKVRATAPGWFGTFREVGAEFEVPDATSLGSWMARV